jgi:hypothetical protein
MLKETLHGSPNVSAFAAAAKSYHKIMATHFPRVTMHIYEHALLMHVHTLLNHGSLLDGSSWFLENYNKVWKQQLMRHSNGNGGKATNPFEEPGDKQSEAGRARRQANSASSLYLKGCVVLLTPTCAAHRCQVGCRGHGGYNAPRIQRKP